ncbi:ribulokinase [Sphingobacterium alkalisoli]|uniref:Ribulokinase n=1 Tax=Sphingobacterium alkalisoli TaxID=1874115 RepID=A0A4U0H1Y2_9SPHI|nr:ribulokinase [Sphingobacterium alkalisoli]TJY65617.1 ribulokinase [Sphingobacterium alkalisoli]GGH19390.1 ribulokinase [Sphingobacterium alkalisoli]
MRSNYVIGVDYGTDSVRSVLVDATNGTELAASVFYYPRWKKGLYCLPIASQFRQHPLDYIEGLETTIKDCIRQVGQDAANSIKAISIDTTGSTPIAVNKEGVPLSLLPEFGENPNAMFVLWKDHTAVQEADEINSHAKEDVSDYLRYVGGIYSSEWFWSKFLHILRVDEKVKAHTYSFVEQCDWIPFLLTGGSDADEIKRGVCSAGHKGLWSADFGGYPPNDFFKKIDPLLDGFVDRISKKTYTSAEAAGVISAEWAIRLGLPATVKIGIGAFDAHMGAVGGQIEPYYLSKVMGTSTCDMMVIPKDEFGSTLVKGICGQVDGSVIPDMVGLEAGQSAFGDAYAWFKNILIQPLQLIHADPQIIEELNANLIVELSKKASELEVSSNLPYAIDWFNGRRTPDANQNLKGAIYGLHLGTDVVQIFRAIVESTCFGARKIVDRFRSEGVEVRGLIGLGGVARKSSFIMQMMADVMNMPIKIHRSEQTCAIGAAMFAATVAEIYPNVETAMQHMGQGFDKEYVPNADRHLVYEKRYKNYLDTGNSLEKNYN